MSKVELKFTVSENSLVKNAWELTPENSSCCRREGSSFINTKVASRDIEAGR